LKFSALEKGEGEAAITIPGNPAATGAQTKIRNSGIVEKCDIKIHAAGPGKLPLDGIPYYRKIEEEKKREKPLVSRIS